MGCVSIYVRSMSQNWQSNSFVLPQWAAVVMDTDRGDPIVSRHNAEDLEFPTKAEAEAGDAATQNGLSTMDW